MKKILIVEDNASIRESIAEALEKEHYQAQSLTLAREVRDFFAAPAREDPALIILDVSLPDGNGFFLCEKKDIPSTVPVLFLTARDDEDDIVRGLSIGGEDYITKPFSMRELLARIDRILRRQEQTQRLTLRDLNYDYDRMEISRNGEAIALSGLERRLLHYLLTNRNHTVSRNALLDKIWDWTGNDVDDHTVTVYMNRLRKKLGNDIITTIKGIGYRIDAE